MKIGKITKIEKHPDAEKLYVETIDDGSENPRVIVSGLVPYFTEEQLLGKTVVIADNLKARKMRGVESRGMLLAADYKKEDGTEGVELLEAPWAKPGTRIVLEGDDINAEKPAEIQADVFFQIEINVKDKNVEIGGKKLTANGKVLTTEKTINGPVN